MFVDRLIDAIVKKDNPSVFGLDPRIEYIPKFITDKYCCDCEDGGCGNIKNSIESGIKNRYESSFENEAMAIFEFNMALIDVLHDIIPAVKLQLACYEMFGLHGISTMYKTIKYAKEKGLLVICDAKRNDIGSSAEGYSAAFLGKTRKISAHELSSVFDADAVTVNPYLGIDGVKPFIDDCCKYGKGIFILVKTSNKSGGQIQDLLTAGGKKVYEIVAGYVKEWGKGAGLTGKYGYSSIGAVVGATYPSQATELRKIMPHAFILVPGYGAQGGSADDAACNFNPEDGLGALVNASRSIMCAWMKPSGKEISNSKEMVKESDTEELKK
ncbi:MAG: orotidine-5'-phosphate decarboxylase, partial [Clostridiales bacterium]|nr:orotidine-5'-phosphate decarboxylase [Clostridiales bacterium]